MSDLLLMSPPGLPRNGLIALWDPYRDAYGRNVLPVWSDVDTFANNTTWVAEYTTKSAAGIPAIPSGYASGGVLLAETAASNAHDVYLNGPTYAFASQATFSCLAQAKERTKIGLLAYNPTKVARFDLSAGTLIDVTSGATATIADVGGGWYRCSITTAPSGNLFFGVGLLDADGTSLYLGDGTSGAYISSPHLTLSPGVMPYSAPAGAPGTLQTSLDYSGNGNHLTLGATTNASTDDPAFTGTAWSFDGGDFMLCNGLRDALKGKTACTIYIVAQRGATTDVADRGILSGSGLYTATDNGIGIVDRLTGTDNLRFTVGDGTASSTIALTAGRLPQTPTIVTCRFIGGSEVAIKTHATAWSKSTTSIVANIKASIVTDWMVGSYSGGYLIGNVFALAAYPQAHGDSTVARVERYLTSEMAKRGVTVA